MADNKYLSQFTLPGNETYYLKDAEARALIEDITTDISSALHFVGTTTTALVDNATTSPITVDGKNYTPEAGDVVIYGDLEFIWSDVSSKWREFGSTGSLKALAFKDSASGDYTPAGSIVNAGFTGSEATITVSGTAAGTVTVGTGSGTANYTPAGSITVPDFTGSSATISVKATPEGSVTISTGSGTANYTPAGSVSAETSIVMSTTNVNSITAVGSLPSLVFSVSGEVLDISWDAGALPTKGDAVTVATGVSSATTTATFSGTGVDLEASFSGAELTSTGSYTPAGTIGGQTFNGTGVELTATFSGSETSATGTYTPQGSVSAAFSGTQATITVS